MSTCLLGAGQRTDHPVMADPGRSAADLCSTHSDGSYRLRFKKNSARARAETTYIPARHRQDRPRDERGRGPRCCRATLPEMLIVLEHLLSSDERHEPPHRFAAFVDDDLANANGHAPSVQSYPEATYRPISGEISRPHLNSSTRTYRRDCAHPHSVIDWSTPCRTTAQIIACGAGIMLTTLELSSVEAGNSRSLPIPRSCRSHERTPPRTAQIVRLGAGTVSALQCPSRRAPQAC